MEMREKLKELLNNSYAPYSKYRVSAICVMKDGREVNGVNIENASYGATMCAERVAIFKAISMVDSDKVGSPCFMCRQVMTEFFDRDVPVYLYSQIGGEQHTIEELCPYPFDEDNL